jgi:glutamate dehydrogenase
LISTIPRSTAGDDNRLKLKIFHLHDPIPLSERVPLLENMAFRVISERSFQIERPNEDATDAIHLHDMTLTRADGGEVDIEDLGSRLESAFMAIIQGRAENDGYNALVVKAGIAWRDIAMLRAVSRYLRQVRIPFSQDYMWDTLARYPEIARSLVQLFHTRFDPGFEGARDKAEAKVMKGIEALLEEVPSLDDDRIIRRFANIIRVTQRTNFFQIDLHGQPPETISFKIASQQVEAMPDPKPFREIFVYSPRVEGVHLRFGEIARGGLRWSDRPQDFRTEVLGLVKAQQVKNAVIVPVGSKGGFVPKQMPANPDRETRQAEGTGSCYKLFVPACSTSPTILSATPSSRRQMVVRHDGDDPYLVVAADKGTATFSDTANAISEGMASGSAMRSRPAAARAMTTRRWASPRAAAGRRSNAISAKSITTFRPSPSPWSAWATCPAMFSAMACCCRRRSVCSRPSITATSSSIPIPIRPGAMPNANGCSICRAHRGTTMTPS